MITKLTIGAAVWAALQLQIGDQATEQAQAVLAQAEHVAQLETDTRCAQAKAYGLEDLRRAGLTIECGETGAGEI